MKIKERIKTFYQQIEETIEAMEADPVDDYIFKKLDHLQQQLDELKAKNKETSQ